MIETEMLRKAIEDGHMDVEAYTSHLPMRRFGQPRDVAEAVLFLASDRSSYVTGQVIVLTAGGQPSTGSHGAATRKPRRSRAKRLPMPNLALCTPCPHTTAGAAQVRPEFTSL
ncbi:SDR family oxidoreductase [Mesorhizobium sp. M4B.F.Ca.ET.214.01.1.1]|nr:MAG: SDR family oxidoreductase [Mesorhizobium sp.]TGQ37789.1 SDR family oxidoreductase [Mesorhizobium sp. M4B.F.Ca.ET.214.01.1.1]TGQ59556.1 SDR family oxidoreductase [Mesorhizobium sp. M4B.F.Ca.ET.211.01.1.1]TGU34622.1 SDR family oxidoreductase [Mesorhizobium sp. M4B.F.Ca.ET.150.01.1.1]